MTAVLVPPRITPTHGDVRGTVNVLSSPAAGQPIGAAVFARDTMLFNFFVKKSGSSPPTRTAELCTAAISGAFPSVGKANCDSELPAQLLWKTSPTWSTCGWSMSKTCTLPSAPSLTSPEPFTVRPGAMSTRTPVGSSNSNALSPTQNSPAVAPSGVIVTFCARAFVIDRVANAMTNNTISFSCLMVHLLCNLSHWKPAENRAAISGDIPHRDETRSPTSESQPFSFVRGSRWCDRREPLAFRGAAPPVFYRSLLSSQRLPSRIWPRISPPGRDPCARLHKRCRRESRR